MKALIALWQFGGFLFGEGHTSRMMLKVQSAVAVCVLPDVCRLQGSTSTLT